MQYPDKNLFQRQLFQQLIAKLSKQELDDEFLELLVQYTPACTMDEHFDIFYAHYALAHHAYTIALEYAQKAFSKRKVNYEIWKILIHAYQATNHPEKALPFQAYCCKFYNDSLTLSLPLPKLEAELNRLSQSMGIANYAPFQTSHMYIKNKELLAHPSVTIGEFIPESAYNAEFPYYTGLATELEPMSSRSIILQQLRENSDFSLSCAGGLTFDIMRSKQGKNLELSPPSKGIILPLAGTKNQQLIEFITQEKSLQTIIGKWEYSFFRLNDKVQIQSDSPFIYGAPIPLGHSPKRKRLILNILVDALDWNIIREQGLDKCLPCVKKFFSKGIIFDQHFSVSEYTYPSIQTIETGLYPHHSQLFNERASHKLDETYITLSEQLKMLGYYCCSTASGGDAIYTGATRGYKRMLVQPYNLPAYTGVERTIQQIQAFSECDQFIFLHIMDVHPWNAAQYHIPVDTQTKLCLTDRLTGTTGHFASPYLPADPIYQNAYLDSLRRVDHHLGTLFAFISKKFNEDDYIIQLYSDHGVPIFDLNPSILSDNMTNAAYMLRGSNIPNKGIVHELTSNIDIYPIMARLTGFPPPAWLDGNLPQIFGGQKREFVISNSIFPGQTYKLCIRSKQYACCLESNGPVDEDGTVDLSCAEIHFYNRAGLKITPSESVIHYFMNIIRQHTQSFDHGGCQWPDMIRKRPEWYSPPSEGASP